MSSGYGEDVWYDLRDHTLLHDNLRRHAAATTAAVARRPSLERSMRECAECTRILAEAAPEPVPAAVSAAPLIHARFSLEDLQELLLPAMELGPGHRVVAVYAEQASVVSLVMLCPPGEPAHAQIPQSHP